MNEPERHPPVPLVLGLLISWMGTVALCVPAALIGGSAMAGMLGEDMSQGSTGPGAALALVMLLLFAVLVAAATAVWWLAWTRVRDRA